MFYTQIYIVHCHIETDIVFLLEHLSISNGRAEMTLNELFAGT